jgi:hypothetical protein
LQTPSLAPRVRSSTAREGLPLLASLAAAILIVALPTLTTQLVVVIGVMASLVALVLVRLRRVLDPAWVVVASIYLVDAVSFLVLRVQISVAPVMAIMLAFVPFVASAVIVHPERLRRLLYMLPMACLAALAALSLLWSPAEAIGAAKLNVWIVAGVLPAAFVVLLYSGLNRVSWVLVASVAVISAVALIAFGTPSPDYPNRPTLFEANPIWAGRAAFVGALIVLMGPFRPIVKVACVPILVVAGLMTLSLGPALAFLLGAFAGMAESVRSSNRRDHRIDPRWALLTLAVCAGLMLLLSGALDPLVDPASTDPDAVSRAGYLGTALPLFLEAPLAGAGFGGFAVLGLAQYPHNVIAEVAAELGILGLVALATWTGLALKGASRSPLLLALVVETGAFALFSGSLASNVEFWLFSALGVAALALKHETRSRQSVDNALRAVGRRRLAPTAAVSR